jgi:hypothetical protein
MLDDHEGFTVVRAGTQVYLCARSSTVTKQYRSKGHTFLVSLLRHWVASWHSHAPCHVKEA